MLKKEQNFGKLGNREEEPDKDVDLLEEKNIYDLNKLVNNYDLSSKIELTEDRFGFEPEFTAKIGRLKCRIYEVGISYFGRTYEEGKKINWKDGIRAIYVIIKYGIFK